MPKRAQRHEEVLSEYLQDPRDAAAYLNAALEDSDEMFLEALGDVANATAVAQVAKRAGVARQAIYRMLSESGNPTYKSLTAILRALGLRIAVEADIVEAQGPSASTDPSVVVGSSITSENIFMASHHYYKTTGKIGAPRFTWQVSATQNRLERYSDAPDIFFKQDENRQYTRVQQ